MNSDTLDIAGGGGETMKMKTSDLYKKPFRELKVPLRDIDGPLEGILFGLRQSMLSMGADGEVLTTAGLGSDFIILKWGKRQAFVRGSELLKAWVETFDTESALRFPSSIKSLGEIDLCPTMKARLAIAQEIIGEEWAKETSYCVSCARFEEHGHARDCLRAKWFAKEEGK